MNATFPIRISAPKVEGSLQVSKWLKFQVLLSAEEMHALLSALGEVQFVCVSELVDAESAVISTPLFQEKYAAYARCLQEGNVPASAQFRRYFSSAMTVELEPFYAIAAGNDIPQSAKNLELDPRESSRGSTIASPLVLEIQRDLRSIEPRGFDAVQPQVFGRLGYKYLIKPIKPVIQLQAHAFFYSELDCKFHPMVLSEESMTWGLQFSYPQLFQDLKTRNIAKVSEMADYPNNALFSKLSKWMRSATLPTPFEVGGVRTNSPIRIGKKSLAWIKNHPQLKKRGITVSF